MEKGLIYSKRYPIDLLLSGFLTEKERMSDEETRESLDHVYTSLKKFWARYQDERSFILKEERVQPAKEFIQQVTDFCEAHQVDVDIRQESFFVSAELYLSTCAYTRQFTTRFAKLMTLSDRMSLWVRPDGSGKCSIRLEFDTHDFYVNGRLINDTI